MHSISVQTSTYRTSVEELLAARGRKQIVNKWIHNDPLCVAFKQWTVTCCKCNHSKVRHDSCPNSGYFGFSSERTKRLCHTWNWTHLFSVRNILTFSRNASILLFVEHNVDLMVIFMANWTKTFKTSSSLAYYQFVLTFFATFLIVC